MQSIYQVHHTARTRRLSIAIVALVAVASLATTNEFGRHSAEAADRAAQVDWKPVKGPGFTIEMPGTPRMYYDGQPFGNNLVVSTNYELQTQDRQVNYLVTYYDLSEVPRNQRVLSELANLYPKDQTSPTRNLKQKKIALGEQSGISRSGELDSQQSVFDRMFLSGAAFYRVRVTCATDHANDPEIKKFFSSLKLAKSGDRSNEERRAPSRRIDSAAPRRSSY